MGILEWLFGGSDDEVGSVVNPSVIAQRIEQVVQMVNPHLRLVAGYERKLAPAVERAVLYCRQVEAQIPQLEMSAAAWSKSAVLRAVFATPHDVPAVFSRCIEVQDFFAESPGAQEVWASLRFRRQEEKRFGPIVQDDVVRQDVAQTHVSFMHKRILQPRGTEYEARLEIRRRSFMFLVTQALEQISSVNTRRKDLTEQRAVLQARLSMLNCQRAGLESMLENDTGAVEKMEEAVEEVERKLAANERTLAQCPGAGETLDYVMRRVRSVLNHGPEYLQIRPLTLRLDQMNIMVPEDAGAGGNEIVLPEVLVKRAPQIHLLVGRFPRSELIRRGSLIDEAQRLLG